MNASRKRVGDLRAPAVVASALLVALATARCSPSASDDPSTPDGSTSADDGAADAAGDAARACSSDVTSDPKNCGRCGHDCLGGACSAGQCQPVIVASAQRRPSALAIDATHVYWATATTLARAPLAGGAVTVLARDLTPSGNILVDATSVYFVDSAQKMVLRVPREGLADGGAPEGVSPPPGYDPTTYDVTGGQAPIAMDRDRIYWATGYGGGSIFVPGRMQSAPKTGVPDGGTSTSYAYHWIGVVGIGVDDTNIYWADTRNAIAFQAKSDGMDAGAIVTIADGQRDVRGLWITADRVYWANTSTGTILAAPKTADAGAPTVFASGQNRPTAIASDDVALYWANEGGDAVLSCPLSGCVGVARIIAGDQATPSSVAVDTGAIYWANTGDGTIMKVAK